MMYTVYDYSLLAEPFGEREEPRPEPFFSTDPQAYLTMISSATDTSLPILTAEKPSKKDGSTVR